MLAGLAAHDGHGHNAFECGHLPRVYHSKRAIPGARSGGVGQGNVCSVYSAAGEYGYAVLGDGPGVKGSWDVQDLKRGARV